MASSRARMNPERPRALRGRSEEIARALALLAAERLVTLRGPPGVGKTALARAIVERLAGRRVERVSFARAETRTAALRALARALGISPRTADDDVVVDRIVRALEPSEVVLVIDGVDGVHAETRAIVEDLLAEVDGLSILVCTRAALQLSSEVVVTLSPLPQEEAIALLLERVSQAAPAMSLDAHARELATCAGGLPLAIEIIAGWVASLGARETLAALGDGKLSLDALDRALDASWNVLGEGERRSFVAWSVFRGAFDLEGARAVAADADAALHLATLASASLIQRDDAAGRYEMLDGVRAYAARRGQPIDIERARDRLANHLAHDSRPRADLPTSWKRLSEERDDLIASWEHTIARAPDVALRLAVVLDPSLTVQGPPALHRTILEHSIGAQRERPTGATVDLLYALGRLDAIRGRYVASRAPFERGIALAEHLSDTVRTAWLRAHLAMSLSALGATAEAAALMDRARAMAEGGGDTRLHATVERATGELHLAAGELEAAEQAYRRAASAARAANAVGLEGVALLGRGRVDLARRDVDAAKVSFDEAKARFTTTADAIHLARVTVHEGSIAIHRGLLADAEACFTRALDEVVLQDDLEGELEARVGLFDVARARGEARLAERRLDDLDRALRGADPTPAWRSRRAGLDALPPTPVVLVLERDGRSFTLSSRPGDPIDFSRRGPLRRLLVALATRRDEAPGRALSVAELLDVGWPGEKMLHASGTARVYMAVRRLRVLGLDAILQTSEAGYAIDPTVRVAWR